MTKHKNIILIGFMGSGKTTVGKVLANSLSYNFIDTDYLVVKNEKMDIPFIFETKGELYFRKAETIALKESVNQQNCVIATGGGIVTVPENHALLRCGFVVYLSATAQQIYKHVKDDNSRPLLHEDNVYEKICALLKNREALYKKSAHITLQVDGKTPEEICNLIIDQFNNA